MSKDKKKYLIVRGIHFNTLCYKLVWKGTTSQILWESNSLHMLTITIKYCEAIGGHDKWLFGFMISPDKARMIKYCIKFFVPELKYDEIFKFLAERHITARRSDKNTRLDMYVKFATSIIIVQRNWWSTVFSLFICWMLRHSLIPRLQSGNIPLSYYNFNILGIKGSWKLSLFGQRNGNENKGLKPGTILQRIDVILIISDYILVLST